ncbi:uncharacterized protein LOC121280786 [Carcharodon carcharias]|uniref:uncharacterized protein LOC121280786 n=1 Tax=Carcharodon carcharias TaxID=13397 RepID=UPI001B7DE739|nr:uncharacterized protein LOC121280786 [Carcharodon carcharias]XP_041048918.1 uncharacterized protein LOC121280786 [Carcharodon carcharias]
MDNSSRLDEVNLAWDNLQEAKSVLQQIENKLHFEEEDPFLEPSVRKHLQSEAFGCGVKGAGNISKQGASPQQPASLRNCGPDEHSTLSARWTPSSSRTNDSGNFNSSLENCHSSKRMFWNERTNPLYNDIIDQDVPLSPVNRATGTSNQDPNCNLSTGAITTRSHVLGNMDMMESDWFMASKEEACSGLIPFYQCHLEGMPLIGNESNLALDHSIKRRILQERIRSPSPSICAFPPSPPGSLLAQLGPQQSKSPVNKLEKLKERIMKQRKLEKGQQLEGISSDQTRAEQPIPALEQKIGDPFKNGTMKHLIRKVTFAPPAPAYKGK